MTHPKGDTDFFISYRGARTDWALWVNWLVRTAGYSTILMDEFPVGSTWTSQMRNASERCLRLIPLYSEDYWESGACREEFDSYWHQHLKDESAKYLLPLSVQLCTVPKMHSMLLASRLYEMTRDEAHAATLKVVAGIVPITKRTAGYVQPEPPFPGKVASARAGVPTPLTWPPRCPVFVPEMANREVEFSFFAETLCGSVRERGTIIAGETDHGKTLLVSEFFRYGQDRLGADACCFVNFKGRGTVDNLLDTVASDLGSRIPGLGDCSPTKLREGLRKAARPVLFVFDTFEHATEEAQDFVETHFLQELGRVDAMRVLLAGQPQKTPEPAKATWRAYARRFNLGSIEDPAPWVTWAARTYPHLPASVVAGIAVSANGAPGPIANQIDTLGILTPAQLKALGIQ